MRILRAPDYRRMPWKNGGGETTEIAVFPAGAGLDDFDWRVSHGDASTATGRSRCLPASTARWPCSKARASCCRSRASPRQRITPGSPPAILCRRPADLGRAGRGPGHRSQRDDPAWRWTHRMERLVVDGKAAIADGGESRDRLLRDRVGGDFGRRGEPGAVAARRGDRRWLAARGDGQRPSRALRRQVEPRRRSLGRLARHVEMRAILRTSSSLSRPPARSSAAKRPLRVGELVEAAHLDDAAIVHEDDAGRRRAPWSGGGR